MQGLTESGSRIVLVLSASAVAAMLFAAAALTVSPREAAASPALSQQTGQPCTKCHTAPPALNAYGKSYKAKRK
jgi:hypothetical protein